MTKGQADLLKCYFSTGNINDQDAQTMGQVIMKLGFSLQRCQTLQTSYHDSRLESLRDGGYFDIESRTIISISLNQILEKAFNL